MVRALKICIRAFFFCFELSPALLGREITRSHICHFDILMTSDLHMYFSRGDVKKRMTTQPARLCLVETTALVFRNGGCDADNASHCLASLWRRKVSLGRPKPSGMHWPSRRLAVQMHLPLPSLCQLDGVFGGGHMMIVSCPQSELTCIPTKTSRHNFSGDSRIKCFQKSHPTRRVKGRVMEMT